MAVACQCQDPYRPRSKVSRSPVASHLRVMQVGMRLTYSPCRLTDQLVRSAIAAGVSHITIHGRTRHQASSEPVSLPGIKFAVECARGKVPCVANGDLWELSDAQAMREETGVKGVMAARGLLAK
jgi:tRNA-dihydrouridine synthase 4